MLSKRMTRNLRHPHPQAVADAKESRKEKKEEKLTKMIEETRAELKEDRYLASNEITLGV